MRGVTATVTVVCLSGILTACGQAGSGSTGAATNSASETVERDVTSLPGDAGCDEVMVWANAGWKVVRGVGATGATAAQVKALQIVSSQGQGLGIRTEDPLLSLIATVATLESLLAEGKGKVGDQDVRKNAETYLRQVAQVCKTDLA